MVTVTRRELDRPGRFSEVRRNLHTAAYEVDGSTFTATFDVDEGHLAGPTGEVTLTLRGAYSIPGLRRGAEGTAYGDALVVRRPRYGWTKASRVIEVDVAGQRFGSVLTEGLTTYRVRDPEGETLSDVVRGRVQLREGLAERDIALCLALHESNLAATSVFRAYLPGSGPISAVESRGSGEGATP